MEKSEADKRKAAKIFVESRWRINRESSFSVVSFSHRWKPLVLIFPIESINFFFFRHFTYQMFTFSEKFPWKRHSIIFTLVIPFILWWTHTRIYNLHSHSHSYLQLIDFVYVHVIVSVRYSDRIKRCQYVIFGRISNFSACFNLLLLLFYPCLFSFSFRLFLLSSYFNVTALKSLCPMYIGCFALCSIIHSHLHHAFSNDLTAAAYNKFMNAPNYYHTRQRDKYTLKQISTWAWWYIFIRSNLWIRHEIWRNVARAIYVCIRRRLNVIHLQSRARKKRIGRKISILRHWMDE